MLTYLSVCSGIEAATVAWDSIEGHMLDLTTIRKRWWLDDLPAYSGMLWGIEDVKALLSEVERLRQEVADLRARSAPSTINEDRDSK